MQPLRPSPAAGGWAGVAGVGPTTVDEASMERSKSFVKALQVRARIPSQIPRAHKNVSFPSLNFVHGSGRFLVCGGGDALRLCVCRSSRTCGLSSTPPPSTARNPTSTASRSRCEFFFFFVFVSTAIRIPALAGKICGKNLCVWANYWLLDATMGP